VLCLVGHQIEQWPGAGVMWSNLPRFDYKGGSILRASDERKDAVLRLQGTIVLEELRALLPDVCVFLTGRDCDVILKEVFPEIEFSQVTDAHKNELARLSQVCLPHHSYRTYHPKYLNLSKKWEYLEALRRAVSAIASDQ
jgi:hypothetical protein